MTTQGGQGWGGGAFGLTPWGGGAGDTLSLIAAIAVRENVVRLEFDATLVFTGILDPYDASNRARYAITCIPNTYGIDGELCRVVRVVTASLAEVDGAQGKLIDLTVDRPFSHYPAQYRVSANNLMSVDGAPLESSATSIVFFGLQRQREVNSTETALPARDIANLPTIEMVGDGSAELVLGSFSVDSSGDYANDDEVNSLRKRILRRFFTKQGAFAHLPGYGIGLQDYGKRLGSSTVRQRIASEAEKQLFQEPEIAKVGTSITQTGPGLFLLVVRVRTKTGTGFKIQQTLFVGA